MAASLAGKASAAALVDDLLGAALTGADHLAVGLLVGVHDVEREFLDAVLLDLGLDLALQLLAGLRLRPHRARESQSQYRYRNDQPAHAMPPCPTVGESGWMNQMR